MYQIADALEVSALNDHNCSDLTNVSKSFTN